MEEQEMYVEEGTTISLKSLWAEIKRSILLIVIITLSLTVLGTLLGVFVVKTNYTSTATLYVKTTMEADTPISDNLNLSERLAPIYASFLSDDSTIVYKKAVQTLNSPTYNKNVSIQGLKDNLTVKNTNIQITHKYVSKDEQSNVILDEIVKSLMSEINSKDEKGEGDKYPILAGQLSISSDPSVPTNDKNTKFIKYTLVFFLLGILVSLITVLVKTVENEKTKARTTTTGTANDTANDIADESDDGAAK